MPITALAPWFGSKRTLASRIIAEFGPHNSYWEPMCGSCAVLLAKATSSSENVNDLHGGITCVARTLADPRQALEVYRRLAGVIPCEARWREDALWVEEETNHEDDVDPIYAAKYLIASWLARNGYGGTDTAFGSFAVRFSATGGTPAGRWRAVVDSIPAWHERLRNVTILNRDCFEVISRINDAAGTVIYLDPPYIIEGVKYDHKFTEYQHSELARLLRRFKKARVLVSYYLHAAITGLYDGWHCLTLDTPKFLGKAGQRAHSIDCPVAPEILLINGLPIDTGSALFGD